MMVPSQCSIFAEGTKNKLTCHKAPLPWGIVDCDDVLPVAWHTNSDISCDAVKMQK